MGKRYIGLIFLLVPFFSVNAYDINDLDFSVKPKTIFSIQKTINDNSKTGLAQGKEESIQNLHSLLL